MGRARRLARVTLEIYETVGASADGSVPIARARLVLASALAAQKRWVEALAEYERVRRDLNDDGLFRRLIREEPDYVLALISAGRVVDAVAVRLQATTVGGSPRTAQDVRFGQDLPAEEVAVVGSGGRATRRATRSRPETTIERGLAF